MKKMNKKAEQNPILAIGSVMIGLILLAVVVGSLRDMSCSDEKQQIGLLTQQRDSCIAQYNQMNESIANCSNLIQEQIDKCDQRIENATQTCQDNNLTYENWVIIYKIYLISYLCITFLIWIPLSINLFNITFKIGLKKEWEQKIYRLEKLWLILKIAVWIILIFIGIASLLAIIFSNPLA